MENEPVELKKNIDNMSESIARIQNSLSNDKRKEKRKLKNTYFEKETKTKIREWDLPKFEANGDFEYPLPKHKKRKHNQEKNQNDVLLKMNKPFKTIKTIDDLFKKTFAKPPIYWTHKEAYVNQIVESTIHDLVDAVVESLQQQQQQQHDVETTIIETNSNENIIKLDLPAQIEQNFKINCFDDENLLIAYLNDNKITCDLIDKKYQKIKSINFKCTNMEPNINLRKFNSLIYLCYNMDSTSGVIQEINKDLLVSEEIVLNQMVSRFLGVNKDCIYFKPELLNSKLESRIYVYDRKTRIKKSIGQCNSRLRAFYFSKSLLQLELLNKIYICLDSDDSFKLIDEETGVVLYSIRLDRAKQFFLTSKHEVVLYSFQKLTYFNLDGYLLKQVELNFIDDESICVINDANNIYLFDKNTFILHKF